MDAATEQAGSLSQLVQSLCRHFAGASAGSSGGNTADTAISVPQFFDVAAIAAHQSVRCTDSNGSSSGDAFDGATLDQLERLSAEFEAAVASETAACAPASVCSLAALLLVALSKANWVVAAGGGGTTATTSASSSSLLLSAADAARFRLLAAVGARFEACVSRVLQSDPPFPAEVQAAVCYCTAQLIVRGQMPPGSSGSNTVGLCSGLLREGCGIIGGLRGGTTTTSATTTAEAAGLLLPLPTDAAVDLIASCSSLVVACRPPRLAPEAIDPSIMTSGNATDGNSEKRDNYKKAASTATKGGSAAVEKGSKRGARRAGNEERGVAATVSAAATAVPPTLPVPFDAFVSSLQRRLIESCLEALAGGKGDDTALENTILTTTTAAIASANVAAKKGATVGASGSGDSGGEDAAALLCRRILIPLLLMGPADTDSQGSGSNSSSSSGGSLEGYERRLHALLRSLGGARTVDPVADCLRRSEAIVLTAALFDFLFSRRRGPGRGGEASPSSPSPSPSMTNGGASDFRCSPFLWQLLRQSFWDAMTRTELDAGRRATMQLRSEYLLKRIVDLCRKEGDGEEGGEVVVGRTGKPSSSSLQLIASSSSAPVAANTTTRFSECFEWTTRGGGGSAASWELFFLVLETLNEFGLHIVVPALTKLDALVQSLRAKIEGTENSNSTGVAAAASPLPTSAALDACWIELLLLKLVRHPNLGVRKVGLRRLWSLPLSVLSALSPLFLYGHAFRSAADPRLCSDLDRVPITATFMETKAYEGSEERAVPGIEPIAQSVETFYAALFTAHLRSGPARAAAASLILDAVADKPSKFTVSLVVRLLCHLAKTLWEEAEGITGGGGGESSSSECRAWSISMVLNSDFVPRLSALMRDTVQEGTALWLDVRLVAIVFDGLLRFAALAPATFRSHEGFWALVCLCGPLGQSGGARQDACGVYGGSNGAVGSSVDPQLLNAKLVLLSRELAAAMNGRRCGGTATVAAVVDADWLVRALLEPATLLQRTRALLSCSSDAQSSDSGEFDEARAKSHFFLLGALLLTGSGNENSSSSGEDTALVAEVAREVSGAVASFRSRAYASEATLLTALASLVEVFRSVGGATAPTAAASSDRDDGMALFPAPTLSEMAATIYSRAKVSLDAGLAEATSGTGSGALLDPCWCLLHTSRWDVLAAAALTVNQLAAQVDRRRAAAALQTPELVCWLVAFLTRCIAQPSSSSLLATDSAFSSSSGRQYAGMIVARDASRLLQSILGGLVYCPAVTISESFLRTTTSQSSTNTDNGDDDGAAAAKHDSSCGVGALVQEAGAVGPFIDALAPAEAAALIASLTRVLTQRLNAAAAADSSLSGQSASATVSEHFRYVYNTIFMLCQRFDGANMGSNSNGGDNDVDALRRTVLLLAEFGLTQVEECWTSNLASVYDILSWVVANTAAAITANNPSNSDTGSSGDGDGDLGVDCEAILMVMLNHVNDVGAKQHARLCSLAFSALQHLYPSKPFFVAGRLLAVLDADAESDRTAYFCAVTAALLVLQGVEEEEEESGGVERHHGNSKNDNRGSDSNDDLRPMFNNWTALREVLLRVAVVYTAGRDEEENESALAATEPLLLSWPDALRVLYPPTVRLATVGRALAISTILRCCSLDYADPSSSGERLVQPLCLELLAMNATDPLVTHEPCMPNSRTHRVRLRLWQLLCVMLPFLPRAVSSVAPVFDSLVRHCFPVNNMGSVRRFIELFAIRLMERQPSLHTRLGDALADYSLRPQVCGTYVLVACYALLHDEATSNVSGRGGTQDGPSLDTASTTSPLFDRLFPLVLQQCTSNQHLLRIISHAGFYRLCRARLAHGKALLSTETAAMYEYIANAPEHVKFREKYDDTLFYNTDDAASPRSLLCVMRKEANIVLRESIPAAAFDRMRFVETETCCLMGATYPVERLRARLTGRRGTTSSNDATRTLAVLKDAAYIPHAARAADYYVDYTAEATRFLTTDHQMAEEATRAAAAAVVGGDEDGNGGSNAADASANIQKKITPWWGSEVYNELHPRALYTAGRCQQRIIVVGSLLLNPVNIAGLCRCGEIFSVEQIVIPEKKVFDHPHFTATARSAELWIPWAEVPPRDLPAYLNEKRREGYTICGIEQTADSVSMAGYEFPEKVVVVLGSEGQGIPAPLIPMLDVCVEIPQYGLIRSLNVHVTGAIVMYEYTKQHLMTARSERL